MLSDLILSTNLEPHLSNRFILSLFIPYLSSINVFDKLDMRKENIYGCFNLEFLLCVYILFAAKLMALIGVKCDYPRTPTVFSLQLNWHGEHDAGINDAIRVSSILGHLHL